VRLDEIQKLTDKWFSSINKKHDYHRSLPNEPVQQEKRFLKVERDVPASVLCKIYHICSRNDKKYYATDIISDIFSNGKSSRLYENLVKKNKIFTEIEAFITGELDEGLFIFYGKIPDNISIETADKELEIEISRMKTGIVEDFELNKIKNKIEASNVFSDISCPNKALKLCVAELLGDANLANTELKHYLAVNSAQIAEVSNEIFNENNCSTIYYMAKK
jgi:predicted Zn-dependent peptidase